MDWRKAVRGRRRRGGRDEGKGRRGREGEGWHLIAKVIPAQSACLGLAVIGGVCALPTRLTGRSEDDDRVNLRRSPALEKEASDARWREVYCKVQTASNLWLGLSVQRRDVTLLRNLRSFVGPWKSRPILALHGNLSAPLSGQPPSACLRCPTVRQQSRPDSDYERDSGIRGVWLVVIRSPRSGLFL